MTNILYEPFPDTIEADSVQYSIVTDFREWLKYADLMADKTVPDNVKMYLLSQWAAPSPKQITSAFLNALHTFYTADALEYKPDRDEDAETEAETLRRPPCFDWCIDARYILGDFRRYYGIDLLSTDYLHWWAFKSLFYALPDESMCMKRISYRTRDLSSIKDRAEQQRVARIQRQIALPFDYSDEMIGAALWDLD